MIAWFCKMYVNISCIINCMWKSQEGYQTSKTTLEAVKELQMLGPSADYNGRYSLPMGFNPSMRWSAWLMTYIFFHTIKKDRTTTDNKVRTVEFMVPLMEDPFSIVKVYGSYLCQRLRHTTYQGQEFSPVHGNFVDPIQARYLGSTKCAEYSMENTSPAFRTKFESTGQQKRISGSDLQPNHKR